MEAIHRGEIKALFSMCFNPLVSLPDANFTREALEKLEFFGVIDFFLSETARLADVVIAGSMQEEDEGVVCSSEPACRRSIKRSIRRVKQNQMRWSFAIWRIVLVRASTFPSNPHAKFSTSFGSLLREALPTTTASPGAELSKSTVCFGRAPI
jgi:predicted molibdopterin-dependent oxidoreductase YjgC